MGSNYRITPKTGLLCRASLAPDEPVSWYPALRANGLAVDKTALLAWLVTRFTEYRSP
jgi:hypothetical protein